MYALFIADTDADSSSFHGKLSILLLETIPTSISYAIKKIFGSSVHSSLLIFYNYIVKEKNPLLQILYLTIINIAFIFFLLFGDQRVPCLLVPSKIYCYVGYFGVFFCQYCFYLACTTDPATITSDNVECYMTHPYDGLIFAPGVICSTCKINKPARSKHCNLCGRCIAKFDHHCIWINQCVGEGNYKYFILFLVSNSCFFIWAAYMLALVLLSEVYERDLLNATFINSRTQQEFKATKSMITSYIINTNIALFSIFILALVLGLAVCGFTSYHVFMMMRGYTTNESYKWASLYSVYDMLLARYERHEKQPQKKTDDGERDEEGEVLNDGKDSTDNESTDAGLIDETSSSNKHPFRLLVESYDRDSTVPANLLPQHPGPKPDNIYNQGIIINIWFSLFPKSDALLSTWRGEAGTDNATTTSNTGESTESSSSCPSTNSIHKPKFNNKKKKKTN